MNRYGHRLSSTAKISAPEAGSASTTRSGGQPRCGITTPCRRAINPPTTTTPAPDLATFGVHRWTRRPEAGTGTSLCAWRTSATSRGQDGNSLLLIPGVSWSRLRVRGGLVPDWGIASN